MKTRLPLLVCLWCVTAIPASAAPILDQQNIGVSSTINGGSTAYAWQQGVTAGITGQLTRIDLFVELLVDAGATAATEVSVNLGAPWQPDASDWSTVSVLVAGWNSFDLTSAAIHVTAGTQFAIGVHGQSAQNFNPGIAISYGSQYAGGALFLNGASDVAANDMNFRTYVDAPEPASVVLSALGLVGVVAWRRHPFGQRKRRVEKS